MLKKIFIFIISFFVNSLLFAQSLNLPFLFKTGYRFNYLYTPTQIVDSVQFQMQQFQIQGMFSLKSKVGLDLADFNIKKMDLGFRQTFLSLNAGARVFDSNIFTQNKIFGNFSLGLTHVRAGIRKGIWLYTGNIGVVQDIENFDNIRPFGILAVANIQILGLKKQNIFGLGVAYTQVGRILPIPLIGLNRRLSDKWDMNLFIPINLAFNYQWTRKTNVRIRINPQFFQVPLNVANIQNRFLPQNLPQNQISMQLSQLETNLILQHKLNNNMRFVLQAGAVMGNQIQLQRERTSYQKHQFNVFPQFLAGIQLNLSDGWLGPQMFMID